MNKRRTLCLLACLSLSLLFAQAVWAQTPFSVKIHGTDDGGVADTGTVTLAVHPNGTAGADSVSPTLKERGLPPLPPSFDMRIVNNAPKDNGLGDGSYTSIHQLLNDPQTDIWKIQVQRDENQSAVTFTWPAGLDVAIPGAQFSWVMKHDPLDADGITFLDVDMVANQTFVLSLPNTEPHAVYVVKGDGYMMRSFGANEIANAVDSKLKPGKAEKRKNAAVDFSFDIFMPASGTDGLKLFLDFGMMTTGTITYNALSQSLVVPAKSTTFNFSPGLLPGTLVHFEGRGDKGKAPKIKYYFGSTMKAVALLTFSHTLRLKMPNINNIGEEIFAQETGFPQIAGKSLGLVAGSLNQAGVIALKPFFKYVYHPKWGDVVKTLDKKGTRHTNANVCLDNGLNLKPILKGLKAAPPDKYNSLLLAEVVALNVNILASAHDKTPDGFGDLVYVKQAGDPAGLPAGSTVSQIAAMCDSVLSCMSTRTGTFLQWDSVVSRINGAFDGAFDTTSFGQIQPGKPLGGTRATGILPVAAVPYLYRSALTFSAHASKPLDIEKLEAVPAKYALAQNYPNPFNPTTTIEFSLPDDAVVTIAVYNMIGQQVALLADNEQYDAGTNEVTFDATSLASGVYYARMIVNGGQAQDLKKMMLMK